MAGDWDQLSAAPPSSKPGYAQAYEAGRAAAAPPTSGEWERLSAAPPAAIDAPSIPTPAMPKVPKGWLKSIGDVVQAADESVISQKLYRSMDRIGGGLQRVLGTAADAVGADDLGAWWLRAARAKEAGAAAPIAGDTNWETVKANPSLGNIATFALEEGIGGIPDMLLAGSGVGLPFYMTAQTGNIGQERATNSGRSDAGFMDFLKAAPAAAASVALERIGTRGLAMRGGGGIVAGAARAGIREGLTEAGQGTIEYAGGTIGTDTPFDPAVAADQALAGMVAGGPFGAGVNVLARPFNRPRVPGDPPDLTTAPLDGEVLPPSLPMLPGPAPTRALPPPRPSAPTGDGIIDAEWTDVSALPPPPVRALPPPTGVLPDLRDEPGIPANSNRPAPLGRENGATPPNVIAGEPDREAAERVATAMDRITRVLQAATNAGVTQDDRSPRARLLGSASDQRGPEDVWARVAARNREPANTEPLALPAPPAAPGAGIGSRAFTSAQADQALTGIGARITSGARTPEQNRKVGGAANSDHLRDQARDIALGPGITKESIRAAIEGAGGRVKQILGPGDKGHDDHFHVAWDGDGGDALPAARVAPDPSAPPMRPVEAPEQDVPENPTVTRALADLRGPEPETPGVPSPAGQPAGGAPAPRSSSGDDVAPMATAQFRPSDIEADAALMQFKAGGDQYGVTDRLRGVKKWEPMFADPIIVWESLDGRRLVADGHQRLGLAKRLEAEGHPPIVLDAKVLREADGVTAAQARATAALRNIGQGTGTSIDAAKVIRDMGQQAFDAWSDRLPQKGTLVREARELARLSPDAFGAVAAEVIPPEYGAAIARNLPDSPDRHKGMVDLLYEMDPPNARQADMIVRQAVADGFVDGEQTDMFGSTSAPMPLYKQKAAIIDEAKKRLGRLSRVYGTAASEADTLTSVPGNAIEVDASKKEASANGQLAEAIDRLATRRGNAVSSALDAAARAFAAGGKRAAAVEQFLAALRGKDIESLARGMDEGGGDVAAGAGGRSEEPDFFGTQPDDERRALERRAEGRDRSDVTQKPPGSDGGLFDDNAGRTDDLFASEPNDATPAPDEDARPSLRGDTRAVPARPRETIRGLGIAEVLRREGSASLVGRAASTPRELAELAQVYRDPRYETFRVFFMRGDEIVHATGVTSRAVGRADLIPNGGYREFEAWMKETIASSGANGYFLLHNHPSGDPTPSGADYNLTMQAARDVPGFRGHVVINSNKFASIDPRGRATVERLDWKPDTLLQASRPHGALNAKVTSAPELAKLAKKVQKDDVITVIGTDAKGFVRVIADYPRDGLSRSDTAMLGAMRRLQRRSGAARLFAIGEPDDMRHPSVQAAVKAGVLTETIDSAGKFSPVSPVLRASGPPEEMNGKANFVAADAVDWQGLRGDVATMRRVFGNPVQALATLTRPARRGASWLLHSSDARARVLAAKLNSAAITEWADHFHAEAGKDGSVGRTYHEAVAMEAGSRLHTMHAALAPLLDDPAALARVRDLLATPRAAVPATAAERAAAVTIRDLLKDTLEYRRNAGEDLGEVRDGYFPRVLDVGRVIASQADFLRRAERLYARAGAPDPAASARAWFARVLDEHAGIDGGLEHIRPGHGGGVAADAAKSREFDKLADTLLKPFYERDVVGTLSAYITGSAKSAEHARRFGPAGKAGSAERLAWVRAHGDQTQLQVLEGRIMADVRAASSGGFDTEGVMGQLRSIHLANLGRFGSTLAKARPALSVLHAWGQVGLMDRVLVTSLTELGMGFVRGGARYGVPNLLNGLGEFVREVAGAAPSDAKRWAEAVGLATDASVSQLLSSRISGDDMSQGAQKVLAGFYKGIGLHQFTEGTRTAALKMGRGYIDTLVADLQSPVAKTRSRAEFLLRELGVSDLSAFSAAIARGLQPSDMHNARGPAAEYATALVRFTNQTIMSPTRAVKPVWASHPVGSLFFSLLSFSYAFKKNVLDRVGRTAVRGLQARDIHLLAPAAGLLVLAALTNLNDSYLRPFLFGSNYDFANESATDWALRVADRSGVLGATSPIVNAFRGLKYDRSLAEAVAGPVVGRSLDIAQRIASPYLGRNSDNTNTAERNASAALYEGFVEPAMDAVAAGRLRGVARAAGIYGTGNRDAKQPGLLPADQEAFVSATAGPKADD